MLKSRYIFTTVLSAFFLFFSYISDAQQPAFPTAEGFGKYAWGGRGGSVIEVTNLNDSGEGSLRAAIDAKGPRTVVFRVSGTIFLESSLRIKNDSITIAGQTAPGMGISLANYNFNVDADEVIVRYIRSRLGDAVNQEADAFTSNDTKNVIIDHCSFSWGIDETASAYLNENFTMQWCIISESLYNSIHVKGNHGYGGIWGGARASFHHNLIAHHSSRNPRFNGARYEGNWDEHVDHRNNLIYNWGFNSAYGGEPSEIDGNKASINVVKNYYKAGPATNGGQVQYRIVEPYSQGSYGYSNWYVDSNMVFSYPEVFENNWEMGVQQVSEAEKTAMRSDTAFDYEITTIHTAEQAYQAVLEHAGTSLPRRDTVDKRIMHEVSTGTATYGGTWGEASGIIDSQNDVGGWPMLFAAHAPVDTDHDGMPDQWELSMNLDPEDPEDRNHDHNSNGYTNLEEYLNSITEFPDFIYPPTSLTTNLGNYDVVQLKWTDNAYQESGFIIQRRSSGLFESIDTVVANQESYTDTSVSFETTYTYRIKAISENDSSVYSNYSEITTLSENPLPPVVTDPYPANGSVFVSSNAVLRWQGDYLADTYRIYLGESTPLPLLAEISDTSYIPDLNASTSYFWRVDAINENGSTKGETWMFSTRDELEPQITGHWDFESIFRATDSTIFENNGSYFNLSSDAFEFDAPDDSRSIQFDGDGQYVQIPYSYEFDFERSSFSIAFWIRQSSFGLQVADDYPYLGKGYTEASNYSILNEGYEISYSPGTEEMVFRIDDGMNESEVRVSRSNYTLNAWIHVAAVRDRETAELRLYFNGQQTGIASDISGNISGNDDLFIGNFSGTPGYLTWKLDGLRLYNYALSEKEINAITGITASDLYDMAIQVYPNPAQDHLNVSLNLKEEMNILLQIQSLDGKIVLNKSFRNIQPGGSLIRLSISGLEPGLYILTIPGDNVYINKKIIIE